MTGEEEAVVRAARELVRAWEDPGTHPDHHRREQERLAAHWPVLARRVASLRAVVRRLDFAPARTGGEHLAEDIMRAATVRPELLKVAPARRLDQEDPR